MIFGEVKFLGPVTIKNFRVSIVNDVNFAKLQSKLLYKKWDQNITEPFSFNNIKTGIKSKNNYLIDKITIAENLITPQINNKSTVNVMSINSKEPQVLTFNDGVVFEEPVDVENLSGDFPDLHNALKNLRNPKTQHWERVTVHGNVTFWDKDSKIAQIFDNVVVNNTDISVISGSVSYKVEKEKTNLVFLIRSILRMFVRKISRVKI